MIYRVGDILMFDVQKNARNITVNGIASYQYSIDGDLRTSKAPFQIGAAIFDVVGHVNDIKSNESLIKRVINTNCDYSNRNNYLSWNESFDTWLKEYMPEELSEKVCIVRFSKKASCIHFFETLPKTAVKLSDTDIKLTRMIPGKKKKWKTNKYGNEIIIDGHRILELENFEVNPGIYYAIKTDAYEGEPYFVVRNTTDFIIKNKIEGKNPFIEMTNYLKIWKERIYLLSKEQL